MFFPDTKCIFFANRTKSANFATTFWRGSSMDRIEVS
mgnify:CR=1 FL=1